MNVDNAVESLNFVKQRVAEISKNLEMRKEQKEKAAKEVGQGGEPSREAAVLMEGAKKEWEENEEGLQSHLLSAAVAATTT